MIRLTESTANPSGAERLEPSVRRLALFVQDSACIQRARDLQQQKGPLLSVARTTPRRVRHWAISPASTRRRLQQQITLNRGAGLDGPGAGGPSRPGTGGERPMATSPFEPRLALLALVNIAQAAGSP